MPNCYYYDEQRNRCNCYVNENLNELLEENVNLRVQLANATVTVRRVNERCAKLRELCADMWRLIEDLDATPYVTERQGNNPAVTWLDEDWSVHESCKKRIRELGVEVDE